MYGANPSHHSDNMSDILLGGGGASSGGLSHEEGTFHLSSGERPLSRGALQQGNRSASSLGSGGGSSMNNSLTSLTGDEGCIYESPSTQIYRSIDTEGKYGPSDPSHPVKVAIKILFDPEPEEDDLAALYNEYKILMTKLSDCNGIRRAIKQGKQDGFNAIFLEWAEGVTLSKWATSRVGRRCGLLDRVRLALEICVTLAEVHGAGVAHREINPDNIIVDSRRIEPSGQQQPVAGVAEDDSNHASFRSNGSSSRRRNRTGAKLRFSVKLIDFGFSTVVVDDESFRDDLAALGMVLGLLFGVDDDETVHTPGAIPRSIVRLLDNLAANDHGTICAGTYTSVKEVIKDIDYMLDEPETYLYDPIDEEVMSILEGEDKVEEVVEEDARGSDTTSLAMIHKSTGSLATTNRSTASHASLYGAASTSSNSREISRESLLVAGCSAQTFLGRTGSGTAFSVGVSVLDYAITLIRSLQQSYAKNNNGGGVSDSIQQDMVDNLAAEGRFNFLWLTQSDALAKSLAALSDAVEPGGWFLAIFFGGDENTGPPPNISGAILSRLKKVVGLDGIRVDDDRVAPLLDPTGMFVPQTYKTKSIGPIAICIVQRNTS